MLCGKMENLWAETSKKQGFIWSSGTGVGVLQKLPQEKWGEMGETGGKWGGMGRKWVDNGGQMGVDGVGMGKDMWYIGCCTNLSSSCPLCTHSS